MMGPRPPALRLLSGLHPANWGQGLATEATRAVVGYAFDNLGFDEIIASADRPNKASIGVVQWLGLSFHGRVIKSGRDTVCTASRVDRCPPQANLR
jgi:RimJ/RimL family protein N-acetyltransferase